MIDWDKVTEIYWDRLLAVFFVYCKDTDNTYQLKQDNYPDAIRWLKNNRKVTKAYTDLMYATLLASKDK